MPICPEYPESGAPPGKSVAIFETFRHHGFVWWLVGVLSREKRSMRTSLFAVVATLLFSVAVVSATLMTAAINPPIARAQDTAQRQYVGNSKCKICHNKPSEGEQWTKWKDSKHSHAYELLSSDEALQVAKKIGLKTKPNETPRCLGCHVTGYNTETKSAPADIKLEDGVQCESCHGPASEHLKDGKKLMMMKDRSGFDVYAHILKPDEKTCRTCHNDKNPTYDPKRYKLEDGTTADFDFKQAYAKIAHPNPKHEKKDQ